MDHPSRQQWIMGVLAAGKREPTAPTLCECSFTSIYVICMYRWSREKSAREKGNMAGLQSGGCYKEKRTYIYTYLYMRKGLTIRDGLRKSVRSIFQKIKCDHSANFLRYCLVHPRTFFARKKVMLVWMWGVLKAWEKGQSIYKRTGYYLCWI